MMNLALQIRVCKVITAVSETVGAQQLAGLSFLVWTAAWPESLRGAPADAEEYMLCKRGSLGVRNGLLVFLHCTYIALIYAYIAHIARNVDCNLFPNTCTLQGSLLTKYSYTLQMVFEQHLKTSMNLSKNEVIQIGFFITWGKRSREDAMISYS